ncbi:ComF family protein [Paludibacterium sp.]|uniref:ComF family protein n=1 Tax=Paludibacterium sp. TaxID=1917523 RepID=UPI0025D6D43B|nr:ComF family protein [Paludibacterium sp.]
MSNFLGRLIDISSIFNQSCVLCGSRAARQGLCAPCQADLPVLPRPACATCAQPLREPGLCGRCLRHPPAFDAIHVPYVFCYPISALVHAFKYGRQLELAGILGDLLATAAVDAGLRYDVVIAVPLSKERLAERGFNQSIELARALVGIIADRSSPGLCWRKCNTTPQAGLGPRQRRRNVRHAFCVETRLDGLSVAVVDDVITTGATLDSLSLELKKQGAKRVEGWALCRTLHLKT